MEILQSNFANEIGASGIVSGLEVDNMDDPLNNRGKGSGMAVSTTSRKKKTGATFNSNAPKRLKNTYDQVTSNYLNNPSEYIDTYTSFKFKQ